MRITLISIPIIVLVLVLDSQGRAYRWDLCDSWD
jgi:hypothetical protein